MTPSRQEIDHPTSSSSSSTSPTTTVSSDCETRAREDLCGIDSFPVAVSSKPVERKERGDSVDQANQKSQTKYHSTGNKFERFRGFLELISRFEFEFCRRGNYFFAGFEFLVCSCECAVDFL